ncbi:ABC transporter permease subunit [Rossellomorea aquimaris]|uniref:Peptide/nickel transport system permease protein n=1 Tax=Rossellomorea aquimaris TaxID=189382 RepID=A0A366ELT5_9BACI|nr:ABC transporter permease subunit [Rossellomorea aquimaris]RBP03392.1 peptide/nickel transport system permease protein [Rossellomorea aquimaris]
MKRVIETPFHFVIVVLGLYLLSGIGSLLAYDTELVINVAAYVQRLQQTLTEIMNPSSIYIYWGEGDKQYPITEVFSNTYFYSFIILFSSFFVAICLAVLFSYILMLLPRKAYRFSERIVDVLDALPDVFIVVLFQLFIIWLFKQTNILVFDIYALGEERIYFLPILCLSVLPIVFLLKQFLFQLKEEESKPYVEFSYSKGFRKSYTVWHHLFRNVWVHFFFHLKPIFLLMLSNLLIIELLFNINGFMQTLLRTATGSPAAFFLGMLLIFVPFFIVFSTGSMILSKWLRGGEQDV